MEYVVDLDGTLEPTKLDNLKQQLIDNDCEDTIVFDNPDYVDAFIGVDLNDRAVYDYDKMIECLMNEDNMTAEDAAEFIDFNTIRSLPYMSEKSPIIIRRLL